MSSLIYIRKNPFNLMMALALMGSVIIFFVLSLAFFSRLYAPDWQSFKLPIYFWLSTVVMLISSGALWQANQQFKLENYERYKNYLAATIILGLIFLAMQAIGAYEMWAGGIKWQHISGAFLFLLGGLHAVHILGGIIWMVVIYFQAVSKRTYVDSFIQSLNPLTAIRLKLLGWYWHFVDFLWIYLFLVFLLSNAF